MDPRPATSQRTQEPLEVFRVWPNPDVHILREISSAINDCCLAADQQVCQLFAVKTLEKFAHHGPRWDLAIAGVSASSGAAAGPESTLPIPPR